MAIERLDYKKEENKLELCIHKKRYELAMKYLKSGDILDIGCGFGYGTDMLSKDSNKVIGIDVSNDVFQIAKSRYGDLTFLRADIRDLPFRSSSFDSIVALEVIEHVSNQEKAMFQILKLLKKDGMLILSTPNKKNYVARLAGIFGIEVQKNPYHIKEFSYKELIYFLEKFNLNIVQVFGIYMPLLIPMNRYIIKFLNYTKIFKLLIYLSYPIPSLSRFVLVVCKKPG